MQNQNPTPGKRLRLHLPPQPEDIIEEILLKLPVKSLLRFRCVSRSWLSLIESDRFIKIHLKTSTQNTSLAHHRAVFIDLNGYVSNGCSLASFLNWIDGSSSSFTIVDDETNNPAPKFAHLLGCCNGLLCLLSTGDDESFSLWNPATRVSIELPKLLGRDYYTKLGFGWDESSGAFKVFASTGGDSGEISGNVYSSKTNSWKPVAMGSPNYTIGSYGVFICGRLHWIICNHHSDHDQRLLYAIESFNLENDEFGRIELPPFYANANAYEGRWPDQLLGEIGGCLFALFDYRESVDFWVMKEYGVKDSWFKLHTFHPAASGLTIYPVFRLPGEAPNGEIFVIYGCYFVAINYTKGNDVSSRAPNMDSINSYRAGVYVESLISLTNTDRITS